MDLTAQQLEQIVTRAVEQAIGKKEITCACGLPPEAQRELGHFMGVVKHMGGEGADGYAKGAEVFRENNRFVARWRTACERTGNLVLGAVVIGLCGIGAAIASMGFWEWIGRGVNGR